MTANTEYVLVPKRPTKEIRDALRLGSRRDCPSDELCAVRWTAALAAAPQVHSPAPGSVSNGGEQTRPSSPRAVDSLSAPALVEQMARELLAAQHAKWGLPTIYILRGQVSAGMRLALNAISAALREQHSAHEADDPVAYFDPRCADASRAFSFCPFEHGELKKTSPLYARPQPASATNDADRRDAAEMWRQAGYELCVLTECVSPDDAKPRKSLDAVISYFQELDRDPLANADRRDAERYRWLRDPHRIPDSGDADEHIVVADYGGDDLLWDASLDRAIDAAIAAQREAK